MLNLMFWFYSVILHSSSSLATCFVQFCHSSCFDNVRATFVSLSAAAFPLVILVLCLSHSTIHCYLWYLLHLVLLIFFWSQYYSFQFYPLSTQRSRLKTPDAYPVSFVVLSEVQLNIYFCKLLGACIGMLAFLSCSSIHHTWNPSSLRHYHFEFPHFRSPRFFSY